MGKIQEFIRLGNLADIIMGQSPDSASCNTDGSGLPFLQGCAEFGSQLLMFIVFLRYEFQNPIQS
jgi:hypothetical protein